MNRPRTLASTLGLAAALGATPFAQFGNAWLSFDPAPGALDAQLIPDAFTEANLEVGDLNGDGLEDLVAVRKQAYGSPGKRSNLLALNESGVLRDRTVQFASSSDVPGDLGFLTPTCDRDVAIVDVDGDGWPEVVTAVTTSDPDPKAIGHPRVYRNLAGPGGAWAGLRHEDARIPQLISLDTGLPQNPRFMDVEFGDLAANGFVDLFFADHDSVEGASQSIFAEVGNHLLVNDGNGFFVDESALRLTIATQDAGSYIDVAIDDLNADGAVDVLLDDGFFGNAELSRQDPANPGTYLSPTNIGSNDVYSIGTGDLNNDGRADVVLGQDSADRYLLYQGTAPAGVPIFSSNTFDFLVGGDDGFAADIAVEDLDGDGWRDVLIADVDYVFSGCNRRLHIYHNARGPLGGDVDLVEEREDASSNGWVGAEGLLTTDLQGTYDYAILDLEGDGDLDLVLARCSGSEAWRNRTGTVSVCQTDLGFAGPGTTALSLCGSPLQPGKSARLTLTGSPPLAPSWVVVGLVSNPLPVLGGTLVPSGADLVVGLGADAAGMATMVVPGGAGAPATLYLQALTLDLSIAPDLLAFSNALEVQMLP